MSATIIRKDVIGYQLVANPNIVRIIMGVIAFTTSAVCSFISLFLVSNILDICMVNLLSVFL